MTDESGVQLDPELLEMGGEALVVRLLEEPGDLIRAAVGARGDLHDWLLHVLPEWGGFEVNFIHLLLSMMPELIQFLPGGAAETLRRLLDPTRSTQETVAATHEWVANVKQGLLSRSYPHLSDWIKAQGL